MAVKCSSSSPIRMSRSDMVVAPISVRTTLNLPAIAFAASFTCSLLRWFNSSARSQIAEITAIRCDFPVP